MFQLWSNIAAYIFWIFIRSLTDYGLAIAEKSLMSDFLQAEYQGGWPTIFACSSVPLFVFLYTLGKLPAEDPAKSILNMWIPFSLFQSLLIILLAFAFPSMINHKYELKLFVKLVLAGIGAFVAFLLIPICTIVQTFMYMVDIHSSQCEGVLWFYFFLSFLTISYFFNPGLSTFF